jgi:ribonuclease T1
LLSVPAPRRTRRPLVALIVLLLILGIGYAVQATRDGGGKSAPSTSQSSGRTNSGPSGSPSTPNGAVALSTLPAQARTTVQLIQSKGPFPYSQDGVVFRNAEGHLPKKAGSYYHEYTVVTPGESDRGARRIITGSSGEYYYTADHYDSFVRVDIQK